MNHFFTGTYKTGLIDQIFSGMILTDLSILAAIKQIIS